MATLTYERNDGSVGTPNWSAYAARIVFSGSATDHTAPISTADWQDGTHSTDGDPGTDACTSGPNSAHNNNVKFVDANNMIVNAGGSEALNDTNLLEAECTFRVHLNNGVAVETQNSLFYCFDGTVTTNEGVGVEVYAFERGVTATAWTQINDDSGNIGGNNSGERLDVGEKASATDSFWYIALSARGESAGAKSSWDLRLQTEVF